jgi:WD40 repeat protein
MQRFIERRELVGGSLPELSTRKLLPNLLSECIIETKGLDKVFASVCVGTSIFYGTKCGHILLWMAYSKPIVIYEGKEPIHSLAVCPQKSWVAATAGARILLFRLPDFVLTHTLNGHEDTVFSVSFVSDFTLVSVSRDSTVCFWNILEPCLTLKLNAHGAKVRNLAFSSSRKELGTISADGFIKLWDSQSAHLLHSMPLAYTKEAIALACQTHLYAVGSQHHISLIDSRIPAYLTHFDSVDGNSLNYSCLNRRMGCSFIIFGPKHCHSWRWKRLSQFF